jgi:DNA repair ATPase RecN
MSEHPSLILLKPLPQQTDLEKLHETINHMKERAQLLGQLPQAIVELNTEEFTGQIRELIEHNNAALKLTAAELQQTRMEYASLLTRIEDIYAELVRKNSNLDLEKETLLALKTKLARS